MPYKLFNVNSNAKTIKNQKLDYLTGVLYLAPSTLASTPQLKINVCSMADIAGCKAPCLNTSGHAGIFKKGETTNPIQQARIRKTQQFFNNRQGFMLELVKDIERLIKQAEKLGLKPLVRLNGTSDIKWENVRFEYEFVNNKTREVTLFQLFPEVQFYDYTKIPNRNDKTKNPDFPSNYDLTFSYSGVVGFGKYVDMAVKHGMRLAVVFDTQEKVQDYVRSGACFKGMRVVDGDATDVRHLDGQGVVVGLYAKGQAKKDMSGFVVRS